MDKKQLELLNNILFNVGDLGFRRRVIEIVKHLDVKDGEILLDCGCGEGFYTMVLSQLFPNTKTFGLDQDELLVARARSWLGPKENVKLTVGDIYHLPYGNDYFDKIILSEVLEHLPDDRKALAEIKRVLKPGGVLVITVPNHNYPFFWDPLNWLRERLGFGHFASDSGFLGGIWAKHLRLYFPNQIEKLVSEVGFRINEIKALTHYCIPFNHNILYAGKQFYTKLPVPASFSQTMEKFKWQEATRHRSKFNFLRGILNVFKSVDNLNDRREIRLAESSMCLLVACQK